MDIVALLACFQPLIAAVMLRPLSLIVPALLTMTGRATMLGLARWMEKGGSYRTVRRWFATALPWAALLVQFFQTHLFAREHEFILAGDATTITKAGAQTHGIGLFFRVWSVKLSRGWSFSSLRWWMSRSAKPIRWPFSNQCAVRRRKRR